VTADEARNRLRALTSDEALVAAFVEAISAADRGPFRGRRARREARRIQVAAARKIVIEQAVHAMKDLNRQGRYYLPGGSWL
jgi:hypothetical protein